MGLALVGPGLIEHGLGNAKSRNSISFCVYTAGMKIPIRSTWLFDSHGQHPPIRVPETKLEHEQ